jgi:hypothetical protein
MPTKFSQHPPQTLLFRFAVFPLEVQGNPYSALLPLLMMKDTTQTEYSNAETPRMPKNTNASIEAEENFIAPKSRTTGTDRANIAIVKDGFFTKYGNNPANCLIYTFIIIAPC